jgi:hypothetical protein
LVTSMTSCNPERRYFALRFWFVIQLCPAERNDRHGDFLKDQNFMKKWFALY